MSDIAGNRKTIQLDLSGFSFEMTDSPIYTLVPSSMFSEDQARVILSQVQEVSESDDVMSVELPQFQATLVYSVPKDISANSEKKGYPSVYYMLKDMDTLEENNKMMVHLTKENIHIVAGEREKLLLANSFPTSGNFVTAQYYLFMVMKEVMFNPEFTTLHIYGNITKEEQNGLKKYFKGVTTHTL